jgi:hypothetical protein
MDAAGHWEPHDAGVIDNHNDDGEGTEKIETWLPFAILKARVDYGLNHGLQNQKMEITK